MTLRTLKWFKLHKKTLPIKIIRSVFFYKYVSFNYGATNKFSPPTVASVVSDQDSTPVPEPL